MNCTNCSPQDAYLQDVDGFVVCTNCGCVVMEGVFSESHDFNINCNMREMGVRFKRIFHFNERLAQFTGNEPSIPLCDLDTILLVARFPQFNKRYEITKTYIREILRFIKDVPAHKINKTRWMYHQIPFKKRRFTIYLERWETIRYFIQKDNGMKPEIKLPSAELLAWMRIAFIRLQKPFSNIQHTDECIRSTDGMYFVKACNTRSVDNPHIQKAKKKYFKCRRNFLNYDLVIRELLQTAHDSSEFGDVAQFKKSFPGLKSITKKIQFRTMFNKISFSLRNDS